MKHQVRASTGRKPIPRFISEPSGRTLRRACDKEMRKKSKIKNTPPKKKSWWID